MKHWKVSYSVKFQTGEVEEHTVTVEAKDITNALWKGQRHVDDIRRKRNADIEKIMIWDIGIVEIDVF